VKHTENKNAEREISSYAVMGQVTLPTDKPKPTKKPSRRKK
jgi:hypothetical protein